MPNPDPWLPLIVISAGLVSAGFIRYLWPYRDSPGGWFFIGTIACETLWIVAYGVALLVFDPSLRPWFEIPIWVGINFIGVFFLAFALEYTGRGGLVRSRWMAAIGGLQIFHTAIVATNSVHHIAWSGYQIVPVYGAATVTYSHTLWLSVNFTGIYLMVAGGAFLLFDAFFSYGRLYRIQAAAIALSPVLPGLAFLLWLLQVGISPPLNFTPLTFPFHLGLVFYAFFRRNMFELSPAARRASERTAIDDLGSAVLVVDQSDRIINLNTEAEHVLGVDREKALGDSFSQYFPDVEPSGDGGRISLRPAGARREYAVTTNPLTDSRGRGVGHTVVLQDITNEIQREQRLGVLNRVLRHNLRNDLNIVQGYIQMVRDDVDRDAVDEKLEIAESKTEDVISLGDKARRFEETLSNPGTMEPVDLDQQLQLIKQELNSEYPNAVVELDLPADLRVRGTESIVDRIFENLLENALEHNTGPEPRVAVTMVEHDPESGIVTISIQDNGPGIPAHEVEILDADRETSLEHGSGLGLWLVSWGVGTLGGKVSFSVNDTGTTVLLELPTVAGEPNRS